MPTMGDKLREARRTYVRVAAAAEQLETAAAVARQEHLELRKERQEAAREAREQAESIRRDAQQLRWALRKPWWFLAGSGAAMAFLGALSYWVARDVLSWVLSWLAALLR